MVETTHRSLCFFAVPFVCFLFFNEPYRILSLVCSVSTIPCSFSVACSSLVRKSITTYHSITFLSSHFRCSSHILFFSFFTSILHGFEFLIALSYLVESFSNTTWCFAQGCLHSPWWFQSMLFKLWCGSLGFAAFFYIKWYWSRGYSCGCIVVLDTLNFFTLWPKS